MDEVQDNLAVQSQESSDFRLFMVAAGVLLEQSLVEQVVNEDIAVFVGDEEVLAEHFHVVDLGGQQKGLLEGYALDVVVADHFGAGVVSEELFIAYPKQFGVKAFCLDGFRVLDCLSSELRDHWLAPFDSRHARNGKISFLYDRADLLFLPQKQRNFSVIDPQTMDDAIAIVDGLGQRIVELLIEIVIGVQSSHGEEQAAQAFLEEQLVLLIRNGPSYLSAHVVERPFSRIQHSGNLLLKDLKLAQLSEPLLAGLIICPLKVYPFLHELQDLLVEQRYLDDLALPRKVFAGAVGADQDVFLLETDSVGAYFVGLQVMFGAQLRAQYFHALSINQICLIQACNKHQVLRFGCLVIMIMEEELSEKIFQSRLHNIRDKYLSYVHIREASPFVLLGLHEHLGLANYFRIILQALSNNQASIIIPNLFGEVQEQSNNEEDDEKFLKQLSQAIVAQTVADVFDEIKSQGKRVIVVGLSIGAAVGLKMLEYLQGVEFSMFFYGLPPVAEMRPERIKSRTIIYCGEKDHVKHLSNKQMVSAAKLKYSENKLVEFYDVPGLDHGFMNPASEHYDEEAFHQCCKHFQDTLGRLTRSEIAREKVNKQAEPEQPNPNEENSQQKKEGSCNLI